MIPSAFAEFCQQHNLEKAFAGTDSFRAVVCEQYICAVLSSAENFEAAKPLLDSQAAYLAFGYRKRGSAYFDYQPTQRMQVLASNSIDAARALSNKHADNLAQNDNVIYYHAEDLERRDAAIAGNPRELGESDQDYFERLADVCDSGTIADLYVNEPGYWDCTAPETALLTDKQLTEGMWHAEYDGEELRILLILTEKE